MTEHTPTPWLGRRICAVTGDPRVFMTYAEYLAALAARRAALAKVKP